MVRRILPPSYAVAKRRRYTRSRRSGLRKSKIPRMFGKSAVHAFERRCSTVVIVNTTNGWTSGGSFSQSLQAYFTLAGTQVYLGANPLALSAMAAADFTALFDEYKIIGVRCQIFAGFNSSQLSAAPNLPVLFMIADYDDVNSLVSSASALEYQNCKVVTLGRDSSMSGVQWYCKPKVQIQTYRTAVTTGYSPKPNQWIDNEQTDVPHYGMKFWIDPMANTAYDFGRVEFIWTYRILCRNVR